MDQDERLNELVKFLDEQMKKLNDAVAVSKVNNILIDNDIDLIEL